MSARSHWQTVWTLLLLLLVPATVGAQERLKPVLEVSFDEAIDVTGQHLRVAAVEAQFDARAKGDRTLSGNRGRLTLEVSPGRRLSPQAEAGTELGLSLTQSWNLGDPAGHGRETARAEREVLSAQIRARALVTRIDAARAWFALRQAEGALVLVEEEINTMISLKKLADRALHAGLSTGSEQAVAQTALVEVRRQALGLEGVRVRAALDLCVAMGGAPSQELKTIGPLPAPGLPSAGILAKLPDRAARLPQVAIHRLQRVAAIARAAEAKARAGRKLSFGVLAQRESSGSSLLFGTAGISFSGSDQGQRQRSKSQAKAAWHDKEASLESNALAAELTDVLHELEHSKEAWSLATDQVLPATTRLLERRQRELAIGEGTLIEVLRSRTLVLQAQRFVADAEISRAWAQVHAWLLITEVALVQPKKESL